MSEDFSFHKGQAPQWQLVEVTPLVLEYQFAAGEELKATVSLRNASHGQRVAFKVKTNRTDRYNVTPPSGILEPDSSRSVRIFMNPADEYSEDLQVCKDRFLIQSVPVSASQREDRLARDTFTTSGVQNTRLKVTVMPALPAESVLEGEIRSIAAAQGAEGYRQVLRKFLELLLTRGVISQSQVLLGFGAVAEVFRGLRGADGDEAFIVTSGGGLGKWRLGSGGMRRAGSAAHSDASGLGSLSSAEGAVLETAPELMAPAPVPGALPSVQEDLAAMEEDLAVRLRISSQRAQDALTAVRHRIHAATIPARAMGSGAADAGLAACGGAPSEAARAAAAFFSAGASRPSSEGCPVATRVGTAPRPASADARMLNARRTEALSATGLNGHGDTAHVAEPRSPRSSAASSRSGSGGRPLAHADSILTTCTSTDFEDALPELRGVGSAALPNGAHRGWPASPIALSA